jgi:RNA polymerase sigma-70 factor (ECF subfamily)
MGSPELIPHLFRTEYRKIVAVLCKRFGFEQIEIAEDIASDTFLTAAQLWPIDGLPANPVAWLHNVAGNRAKNFLHRNTFFQKNIIPGLKQSNAYEISDLDLDLSQQNIADSELQMMFAVCHPLISAESQISLSLRILCGFGIEEIADAFLTNKETVNKRLFRAKEKLREEKIKIELPSAEELEERLSPVLATIYLLFNEGYYSVSNNETLRKDLCFEAMRLCSMLIENKLTEKPQVHALMALMCFHASRFEARINSKGEMVLYEDQDVSLWNQELIGRGVYFLRNSSTGDDLSKYHLEATIAYWSTQREDTREKWESVLQLYNRLLQVHYSPIAALNRTYALFKVKGKETAIVEAEKLRLDDNHFYFTLLGELYSGTDDQKAKLHFERSLALAKTDNDKIIVRNKIEKLASK